MAYIWWYRNYHHQEAYRIVEEMRGVVPFGGWLKMAREALFLSIEPVAERLKMTRSAYGKLEKKCGKKTISTRSLEEAAAALNCELIDEAT